MKNWHTHHPASIYPGEYEPLAWTEMEKIRHKKGAAVVRPPFSIEELQDRYNIELHVPGFNREDFAVYTNGFSLNVGAVRKNTVKKDCNFHKKYQHLNEEYISVAIPLPGSIDNDFVTAEYKNGILMVTLIKTKNTTAEHRPGEIIVY